MCARPPLTTTAPPPPLPSQLPPPPPSTSPASKLPIHLLLCRSLIGRPHENWAADVTTPAIWVGGDVMMAAPLTLTLAWFPPTFAGVTRCYGDHSDRVGERRRRRRGRGGHVVGGRRRRRAGAAGVHPQPASPGPVCHPPDGLRHPGRWS